MGLVGESGSGKTLTVLSILGLLPAMMDVEGLIIFAGQELLGQSENDLAKIRGRDIAMVFQDPSRSLNPTMKVGRQVGETLQLHTKLSKSDIAKKLLSSCTVSNSKIPRNLFRVIRMNYLEANSSEL